MRAAVSVTAPTTEVRVELRDGRRLHGPLVSWDTVALVLGDSSGARTTVPYGDVTRYWRRGRAWKAGAITGSVLGAASGAFLGMIVVVVCEYDCSGSVAGGAVVGGLAGAVTIGAVGAVVGAAIPRWSLRWRGQAAAAGTPTGVRVEEGAAPPVRARRTGELTLLGTVGYGGFPGGGTSGEPAFFDATAGVEGGLAFRRGRVAFGPEVSLSWGGTDARSLAGLFRVDVGRAGGRLMPYVIAGAGAHSWDTGADYRMQTFTGTFGLGATTARSWRIEVRAHPALQYPDEYQPHPFLVTLAAGRRIGW